MAVSFPATTSQRAQLALVEAPPEAIVAPFAPELDRDYWLAHCDGYRVDGDGGRVGFVEEARVELGRVVLRVRLGRLGRRVLSIGGDEVAFVVPRAERIWLRSHDGAA